YPTIEFITAILFAFLYAAWFGETAHQPWFGGALRPAWAEAGIAQTWPFLALVFVLLGGLIAMTLIDARTFMIPPSIPWFVTAAALLMDPSHAAVVGPLRGGWTIPLPEAPPAVWASLGGMLGVAACAVLLKMRVIPRSFAGFDA